ncbi:MAG: hypothetical protein K6G71_09495 [Clostridiales bacterium]|nr:hypothetical protein [Clostridiales bacterium]
MKRLFALILAVAALAALLCACGESKSTVTTTVNSKYDDGYAKPYASNTKLDENGNTVYEFTEDQYKDYTQDHNNSLSKDMQKDVAAKHKDAYGEFIYINEDKKAVIVGIHEKEYKEKTAQEEAKLISEYGFKYFQNLQTPVNTISVIFCNANNQAEEYGRFEFTAE